MHAMINQRMQGPELLIPHRMQGPELLIPHRMQGPELLISLTCVMAAIAALASALSFSAADCAQKGEGGSTCTPPFPAGL